jgi:hypothetical protein
VGGDPSFEDLWEAEPDHLFRAVLTWEPSIPLYAWAMLRWSSATEWTPYQGIGAASAGRYSERIPDRWELDLALRKSFLAGRARAGFTIRNAFDEEIRLHPIGAGWNLGFYVHAELETGL